MAKNKKNLFHHDLTQNVIDFINIIVKEIYTYFTYLLKRNIVKYIFINIIIMLPY